MKKPVDKILLQKFIDNSCSDEEISIIREFLEKPGSDLLFEEILNERMTAVYENAPFNDRQLKVLEAKFYQKIALYTPPVQRKIKLPRYLKYAAIWIILILSAGGYSLYQLQQKNRPIALLESSAPKGKLVKVLLPDSTIVFLNAASSLHYPERFEGKTREVTLHGEAFFEVKHDQQHPFLVRTEKLNINVLGTSFNIRSYQDDHDIAITVATGKVGVTIPSQKGAKASFLLPNNELIYHKSSGKLIISKVNAQDSRAWETGSFVFEYETLENITRRLSRWYNIRFICQNQQLLQKRFKMKLHNENLRNVMEALSNSGNGFQYTIKDKQVTIK